MALTIVSHLVPLTLTPADFPPSATQGETAFSFEPLQVCDNGSDFSGFLADHPWVPGSVCQAPLLTDSSCCPNPSETEFSDGIPRSVYRPPRPTLS